MTRDRKWRWLSEDQRDGDGSEGTSGALGQSWHCMDYLGFVILVFWCFVLPVPISIDASKLASFGGRPGKGPLMAWELGSD